MDQAKSLVDRMKWACQRIVYAKEGTIDIIKNSTLANVRSIERNSRSVKDPNPLMSTMTNINQKYPITVRKDSIDIKSIPQELVFNKDDNRRHNRILCKKELVTWYINTKIENKEEDKSITKLFDSNLKKFDLVFTYPWESTHFKIGHVLLSRNLVSVNPNDYDIPKDLIKPAILHSLGLSNLIEYNNVPDFYLEQIKSIIDNSNLDVRKVPNMLNYLQNHLDPRMRYLPVINGMKPDFVYIAHALVQPNFRVENLMEESSSERGQNKEITETCINLIRYCQINNIPYHKIKDLAQSVKINDYPLLKLLENTDENKYTRFIKGVVGLKISALIERDGITYYPAPTNIYESNHSNSIGTEFKRLNGSETVYFESSISKGFFVHNADALLSVTINRTTLNELIYVLSNIAVFITKDFEQTTGNSIRRIRQEIKNKFMKKWNTLVNIRPDQVRAVRQIINSESNDDITIGILRFSSKIETTKQSPEYCYLKDGNLYNGRNGQLICVAPITSKYVVLDYSVKISEPQLYHLMNPYRILTKAIQFNLSNIGQVKKDIREGKFVSTFFEHLTNFVPISLRKKVSSYVKSHLQSLIDVRQKDLVIASFYSFAYGTSETGDPRPMTDFMFYKDRISFALNQGVLKTNTKKELICNNEIIARANKFVEEQEFTCSVLPDFTVKKIPTFIRGVPVKSLNWLKTNNKDIPNGFCAVTVFQTSYYLMTKVMGTNLQTIKTLKRHIETGLGEDASSQFSRYLLKRRLEEEDEDGSGSSETKRRKAADASSIIS